MTSQTQKLRGSQIAAGENGQLAQIASLSCFTLWLFFVLFNSLFFENTPSVLAAIRAYGWGLAIVGVVSGVLLAATKLCRRPTVSLQALRLPAFAFSLVCCGAKVAEELNMLGVEACAFVMVAAAAIGLALMTPATLGLFASFSLQERFAASAGVLAFSLAAFCLVLLAPSSTLRLTAVSAGLVLGVIFSLFDRRTKVALSPAKPFLTGRLRIALVLLLFGGSFLCSYELNAMQKTTHFVSTIPEQIFFGGSSLASLLAIGLTALLLFFILLEIRRPTRTLAVFAFAMILLSVYYCLPIMSTQKSFPISFTLILALGSAVSLSVVFLYLETATRERNEGSLFWLLGACTIMAIGALGGTFLAYLLIGQLETLAYISQVLSFLPALIIFALASCLFFYRKELLALFKPPQDEPALERLDTSLMDDRCKFFAQKHKLTKREAEMLRLISQGRNIPGIADSLVVSKATAKTHALHIYKKVGVSSRQELIDLLYSEESETSSRKG